MGKHVSSERRLLADQLRSEGASFKQISKEIGVSMGSLSYWYSPGQVEKAKDRAVYTREYLDRYIQDYKEERGCQDCRNKGDSGVHPFYVLDADHVLGKKTYNISKLSRLGSLRLVKEELAKCDIVCSNHHRYRTYQRSKIKREVKDHKED